MTQSSRSSWDLGRFIQTLDYFEAIPVVSWFQKALQPRPQPSLSQPMTSTSEHLLFDFRNPGQLDIAQTWGALDDVVMGGVSDSYLRSVSEGALFGGTVSTANSGGFVSVRTRNFEPPIDLSGYTGLRLSLQGDGNRYKFLVRDGSGWDSLAYCLSFDTVVDTWITVQLPFDQMVPVFRAKTVANAQPLQIQHLTSFQLMLSKFEYDGQLNPQFQAGDFRLTIATIVADRVKG